MKKPGFNPGFFNNQLISIARFLEKLTYYDLTIVPLLFDSIEHSLAVHQDLEVRELLRKRFQNHNLIYLGVNTFATIGIYSVDKPIIHLSDLKGMPVRGTGRGATWMVNAGASNLNISSTELYMAIQRGMIKGWQTSYASQIGMHLYEVSRYLTDVVINIAANGLIMNLDSFNKLPQDLQLLLLEQTKVKERELAEWSKRVDAGIVDELMAKGMTVVVLPPEDIAEWRALAKPIWKEYEEALGKDGPILMAAIEKYRP